MKRSEWMVFAEIARGLRTSGSGAWGYADEAEARYEDGRDAANESAAESIEDALKEAVVDVEDVELCSGVLKGYGPVGMHPVATLPWYLSLKRGCEVCTAACAAKGMRT